MKKSKMSENSMRGMGHAEMMNKAMMKGMPPADKKMKPMAKKRRCK